ncbi:shikimate dehydrogenase [Mastigocoleus testarum]|uniref:Shikimate dehydrogenase (NADP(+)) n=1 Tax=Mastigocoleus testarum BC008 TaxID=371196 RepID=A0A0V7ZSZ2_9CYAN|nr:shikimate dehydrogenase [Mastigocoleus testarum]KST67773.1 shikimate dehydrogenase [Mastigocoleus testarum BC008]
MTNFNRMITGKTKLLGVIGHPVEHSLSPKMHNAAITHLGLDYVYLPFPIEPENLEVAVAGLAAIGVVGFSVTIPHKQAILPLLAEVDPIARAVGAVNTVTLKNNQWVGTNTDVEGFVCPLRKYDRNWEESVVVILGNGGAARAVVAGCKQLGCKEIHIVGRNPAKLQLFAESWVDSPLEVKLQVHEWSALPSLIPSANLLVNTTPVGMYPKVEESPLSIELVSQLPQNAIAYDLIYTPNPSKFLQIAQNQGATKIDGLEMLVQQGAIALQSWLPEETIPVDIMQHTLREHLGWAS